MRLCLKRSKPLLGWGIGRVFHQHTNPRHTSHQSIAIPVVRRSLIRTAHVLSAEVYRKQSIAWMMESEKSICHSLPMQRGYTFVAKGNVYITRHCRSRTKELGKTVFAVVDGKGRRIGLRCPQYIHDEVLAAEHATALDRQSAVAKQDDRSRKEALAALVCLFPKVPPEAAEATVRHAFEKRSGRVGRKGVLSLDDRVTRALVAHIRHCHTPYDTILRNGVPRDQARRRVQSEVSRLLQAWLGLPAKLPQKPPPEPGISNMKREKQRRRDTELKKRTEKKSKTKRRRHPY